MAWQLLPAREHFSAFAADWDRLNAELHHSHPMFDSRFLGALLEHFGTGNELLCLHRTDGQLDGALIVEPRGFGRWSLFLPAQMQAGAVMLADASLLESLLHVLPGYAWSLDLLSIDPLYAPDWSRLRLPRFVIPHANTMAVTMQGSFDHYWQSRSKNLIQNIKRYRRRAEENADPLSVKTWTNPEAIAAALLRYGQLESSGWKGKAGTAISPDNAQGRFYADVLDRFARKGQAFVMELYAGEKLVASRLFLRNPRMWIALKTTYDETQSSYAPGRLLLHAALERAFAELPNGNVEFYTNATRDQALWATHLRPIPHHQIVRSNVAATFLGMLKPLRHDSPPEAENAFNPLKVECYSRIAEMPPAIIERFDDAEEDYPEFAAGWFDNLQRSVFGNDPGVHYYVAVRADHPVAILPARLVRHGHVRRVEALANFYTSLYQPILAEDATTLDLAALLKAASDDHGGAHEMRFAPMDPDSRAYAMTMAALRSNGWIPFRYFCFGNWFLQVDGDWPSYFANRPGALRSTIKRKGKKFAAAGGTLEIIAAAERVETAIAEFNAVYARSWKRPEPFPDFIPGLICWLAEKGWLRLGIARLDGQPIAAQLWIVNGGKAYIFKLAYDETYAPYGAGTLLTAHLMQHVIERDRVQEVDYLIGDDEYKKDWMSGRRERLGIVAYKASPSMSGLLLGRQIIGLLVRRILTKKPRSPGY